MTTELVRDLGSGLDPSPGGPGTDSDRDRRPIRTGTGGELAAGSLGHGAVGAVAKPAGREDLGPIRTGSRRAGRTWD